jgi:putative intracellular protease/amidase
MTHNDFGEKIVPTTTISQATTAKKMDGSPDDIDVLIVPGGGGTREPMLEEIEFVKAMYPKVPTRPAPLH